MDQSNIFELVIAGGGCVGMAATFYALQKGWKVCLIEHQQIGGIEKYGSSNFGARQNRVQYNEDYLIKYAVESNKEWKRVEDYFNNLDQLPKEKSHKFLLKQGALWFGDASVTTSEGSIKTSNAAINLINAKAQTKQDRIESLYMDKLMEGTPDFMKAFKPYNPQDSVQSEWDTWSSLYQPDGGSVNMQTSYKRFYDYAKGNNVTIFDKTSINKHHFDNSTQTHAFQVTFGNGEKSDIHSKRVLIAVGIHTPFFLKNVMGEPYLVNNQQAQYSLEEYVTSYIKIENSVQATKIYDSIPNYINFVGQTKNIQGKQPQPAGYGFRFHSWDNPSQTVKLVKLGTMAKNSIDQEYLKHATYAPISNIDDHRIVAARNYARHRMTHLLPDDKNNVHYPCPIIFYQGRQTLLDYLNRTEESIVVQSGGSVGKYYPLLAKTAIQMLSDPNHTHTLRSNNDVMGNFINRTRFPITSRVNNILDTHISEGKTHFETAIIGAGCSGLYAAYRLNKQKHQQPSRRQQIGNIGVFQLSDRISGRLKSFKFQGTTTPMQLGGMRYFPTHHILVNQVITELGIPSASFPMSGDPIQQNARLAYLRNDYYHMNQWKKLQSSNFNLHTAYRLEGPIVGMDSSQIINFSFYKILTAPENINLLTEVFLSKTDDEIAEEKQLFKKLGVNVHYESSWYRNWKNYIYPQNSKSHQINLSLRQWNQLKPLLLFRFRSNENDPNLQKITYPLYKFGFQNVIQAQFGHQAYQFVTEMYGYYSYTSNSSYIDQVKGYRLDFGKATYRTLISGYDQINFAMANVLISKNKGLNTNHQGIFLHHKLVDILPGKAYGKKYVLVFHVASEHIHRKNYHKTPINLCSCKKPTIHLPPLGVFKEIPENPGYSEIRFTADRVVLGMPKKSVVNLINEVDLMKKPIEVQYKQIYQQQKNEFFKTFTYPQTNQYITIGASTDSLNQDDQLRLSKLLLQQQASFTGGNPLNKDQNQLLQTLSRTVFVKSIKQPSNQHFQQSKPAKFDKDPPIMHKNLLSLANSSKYLPSMKIVMNFDRNWWDPNIQYNRQYEKKYKNMTLVNSIDEMRGVSVTDLPTRQTLYFSSGPDNIMLASYNDMVTTEFWTALHDNFEKVWQPISKNAAASPAFVSKYPQSMDIHPAKEVLVHQILKQLSLIHQVDVKEEWVRECIFQFWGNDPYGAGYHGFYSGYDISSIMKCIRKPWKDQEIHVVGQAYSNQNGWVEGCFQTVERLFQEELKLPEAVKGYYPGY